MSKKIKTIVFAIAAAAPSLALAQAQNSITSKIIQPLSTLVTGLVPILMTVALLYFIWGLIKYIMSAGDPIAAGKGKSIMIYGVIALFVMSAIWGLTGYLGDLLGVSTGSNQSQYRPSASQLTPGS